MVVGHLVGLRRICPRCAIIFYICLPCDKWHWYCSDACSRSARQISLKAASRKYRRSKKGRRTNSQAQNTFRKNQRREKKVSHQSYAVDAKILPPSLEAPSQSQERDGLDGQQSHVREDSIDEQKKEAGTLLSGKRPVCTVCRQIITHIRPQGAHWHGKRKNRKEGVAHDHNATNSS
jgi:hypothetical protein